MEFHEKLQKPRKQKGLTQEELAYGYCRRSAFERRAGYAVCDGDSALLSPDLSVFCMNEIAVILRLSG